MPADSHTELNTEREEPGKRGPNFFGLAGLICLLSGLIFGYLLDQPYIDELRSWAGLPALIGYSGGVVLAVVSLLRREPRGPAIATLIIAGALLLLLAISSALLWWVFSSQPPCEGGPFCFNPA
ncbi:hypothetical protein G7068_07900 [Leucobacter viscericola]|uniref:Uncharacterized protein n=1 Tax=Leucobacter viscericola TaxID=2714935 RepID=A0A6G7XF45_9MICO|nr:hypothetical protein [Leucobacter viscericola]QIK63132.1 hypothetical protein G7068_07900 [Leucobacter viscericola]